MLVHQRILHPNRINMYTALFGTTWQRISSSISSREAKRRSSAWFLLRSHQQCRTWYKTSQGHIAMYPSGRKPIEHRIHNCQIQSELSSSNHLVLGFHFRSHMFNRVKSVDSLGFTIGIPPKYPPN